MKFVNKAGDDLTPQGLVAVILLVVAVLAAVIYPIHQIDSRIDQRHEGYRQDCLKLNPKYGKYYTIKAGPYEGVTFYAAEFGEETVGLKVFFSNDTETRRFLCGDLVEVKL